MRRLELRHRQVFFAHAIMSGTARRTIYRRTSGTSERATSRLAEVAAPVANIGCGIVSGDGVEGVVRGLSSVQAVVDNDRALAFVLFATLSAGPCVARGAVPRRWVPASAEIHAIGVARARATGRLARAQEDVFALVWLGVVAGGSPSHAAFRRSFHL